MDAMTEKAKTIRGAKATPEGTKADSKRERFVLGAELRTANAIRGIRMIGKLANSARYEYREEDVRKITAALGREVDGLKLRMTETSGAAGAGFKL